MAVILSLVFVSAILYALPFVMQLCWDLSIQYVEAWRRLTWNINKQIQKIQKKKK